MNYDRNKYVGKCIKLFPCDTNQKWGIIEDVDDLGWTIRIVKSYCRYFVEGTTMFISHSKSFEFVFVEKGDIPNA